MNSRLCSQSFALFMLIVTSMMNRHFVYQAINGRSVGGNTAAREKASSSPVFPCPISWPESALPSDPDMSGSFLTYTSLEAAGWTPWVNGSRSIIFARDSEVLKVSEMGWPHCSYSLGVNECAALNYARCNRVSRCLTTNEAPVVPECFSVSRAFFNGRPVHVVRLQRFNALQIDDALAKQTNPEFISKIVYRGLQVLGRFQNMGIVTSTNTTSCLTRMGTYFSSILHCPLCPGFLVGAKVCRNSGEPNLMMPTAAVTTTCTRSCQWFGTLSKRTTSPTLPVVCCPSSEWHLCRIVGAGSLTPTGFCVCWIRSVSSTTHQPRASPQTITQRRRD